jgi:hypothetical protein
MAAFACRSVSAGKGSRRLGANCLARLSCHPRLDRPNALLAGLRHVVQATPDGILEVPAFDRGIAALLPLGLVYDILIHARQLPETTSFDDRQPNQQFVLDHIAKPHIKHGGFDYWNTAIRDLARLPTFTAKLSGMVTEAKFAIGLPLSLSLTSTPFWKPLVLSDSCLALTGRFSTRPALMVDGWISLTGGFDRSILQSAP